MACYGRQCLGVKPKEDVKPLDELLSLGNSPQLSRVPEEQSPFLYIKEEEQRPGVTEPSNELPMSDMDLAGFLDMDDKTLSELTGVDSNEWTTLFNGQLDERNVLDPMIGVQHAEMSPKGGSNRPYCTTVTSGQQQHHQRPAHIDRWLVEETHKLERQQRLQQQKLLELQQTLLKTEILKNQLQIATISQGQPVPPMSTTCSILLGTLGSGGSLQPQQDLATSQLTTELANDTGFTQNFGMPGSNSNSTPASPKLPAAEPIILEMGTSPASVLTPTSNMTTSIGGLSNATSPLLVEPSSDIFTDTKPDISRVPPFSPMASDDDSPKPEPSKRKVHNLIEKKYRCSINDRICMLRDMVSKHAKDNKKLQKSAVLQKTIDFIHHLQNTIRKLQDENQQLKESLARATGNARLPSFASPPNTPSGTPYESEGDSGHPSSPDDSNSDGMISHSASPSSKASFFSQFLQNPLRPTTGAASQYLMVVMLVAVFFINPFALSGQSSPSALRVVPHSAGSVRTINAYEMDYDDVEVRRSSVDVMVYVGVWMLRVVFAALCFGYMTLKAMPRIIANSQDSVQFWRFKKQAEKDIKDGDFTSAKDNLEVALSVINRPLPTSYLCLLTALLWNMLFHFFFELVIGRYAVHLASIFVRAESGTYAMNHPKKVTDIGVSFRDVSETYHLLHQISLSTSKASRLHGMSFFLGLNALNFAEADRPFHRLSQRKLAEMYFTMGLCCHYSFPYGSRLPMWFYFFRFRNVSPSKYATTLKWAVTPPGKAFLMSSKWTSEVGISPKRYAGTAALAAYAVTRAFCKELLCETFGYLLLPNDSPNNQPNRDSEVALQAFKLVLNLAKEATSCLLNAEGNEQHIRAVAGCSDSGFTVIQWWASVGIVSCYWLSGKDSSAEDYYPNIEALSGEMGAAVPSAIQLAFKANRKYKMPSSSSKVPLQVVLQLSATTSNSLKSSVANLLQDHSNSTDNELHHLGLLQACDWLLSLKVTLWENHGNEDNFSKNICPGFYQDLETLSKLITLLPSARSRLHLYKGCYQLMAGANPMTAHAMFNSTGSASRIRRRTNSKDVDSENPALYSHEHVMAKMMANKHLPWSMESPYNPNRQQEPLLPRTQVTLP